MYNQWCRTKCVHWVVLFLCTQRMHWVLQVARFQNEHADDQLLTFYRWLKMPEAKLYDPALFRMIQGMMQKVFLQLVSEFKRLGAKIIHATMNRIVIGTGKTSCVDAHKYMEYIIDCIKGKVRHALSVGARMPLDVWLTAALLVQRIALHLLPIVRWAFWWL